jgi:hypothetical protein
MFPPYQVRHDLLGSMRVEPAPAMYPCAFNQAYASFAVLIST